MGDSQWRADIHRQSLADSTTLLFEKVLMLSKFEAIQAMIQLGARVICRQRIEGTPLCVVLASILCFGHGSSFAQETLGLKTGESSEGALEFFETKIRPLFIERCYECHSADSDPVEGGLRIDGIQGLLKGGDSGPAVVPEKPEESLLVQAVEWKSVEMPPDGKLAEAEIEQLKRWIEMGAPWPEGEAQNLADSSHGYDFQTWRTEHWSFRPIVKPQIPEVRNIAWPKNHVDSFVLSKLENIGLQPAPAAQHSVLVRRLYWDLIGLPPEPEAVDRFVKSAATHEDQAVSQLVDELLDSPHYGERWGRHWLDVARYSDGYGGFLDNAAYPQAWHYRDWVVQALNRDLPLSQFLSMQIAGDLIGERDNAVATGFFALGPTYNSDGGDPESVAQAKAETLSDRLDTLGRGMLGLTLACSRCHDHKFDPIPQSEYYGLAGVFNNTGTQEHPLVDADVVKQYQDEQTKIKDLQNDIKKFEEQLKKEGREASPEEASVLAQQREDLETRKKTAMPKYDWAHSLRDTGSKNMPVAIRGDLRKPGEEAKRRFLEVLVPGDATEFREGSGRKELAAAIIDSGNPLTSRVFVNRIWLHHFGHGLVRTPSNFGSLGESPTHPELLDYLATYLREHQGSIKALHRLILNSSTYRMSSKYDPVAFAADGANRYLWRMNPRRMDVETWRDSLLSVTGELDLKQGGPPLDQPSNPRRTLYFKVSRNGDQFGSDKFLRLFDFPLMRATIDQRPTSIVPQQFLFLMNSPFMLERARKFSERLTSAATTETEKIHLAHRLLYGREPTPAETEIGLEFLGQVSKLETDAESPETQTLGNEDLLIEDFEGSSYGDWEVEGEAFGAAPAQGTLAGQMVVTGFLGRGLVNSFNGGDGTVGSLTSPEFIVQRDHIHFLVGGGKYPGKTCVELWVEEELVLTATGPNDRGGGSEQLDWHSWDVARWKGKTARIRMVDARREGWGHINVDHIFQSDLPIVGEPFPDRLRPVNATPSPESALTQLQQYCQVLLSSNEFMFIP